MLLNLLLTAGMSLTGLTSPKEEGHTLREQTLYIDLNRYNLNQKEIVNPDYDIQVRNTSVKGIDFDNISYSVITSNGQNTSFNDAMEINTTSAQINGSVSAPQTQWDPYKIIYDHDYYYCVALQWFYLNLRLDPRGANLTCTVYNEVEEAICSIPANGTSVNYLLELKPGAYYIELKGTTNNDYGGYQLNFGSNDIETDELKDTLVINDTIKQNYVGAMWTTDYLPGGRSIDHVGETIYTQTIDGTDVYPTCPPRSYELNYSGFAQIFYIWDSEVLDILKVVYEVASVYIDNNANQIGDVNLFESFLDGLTGNVVDKVIELFGSIFTKSATAIFVVELIASTLSSIVESAILSYKIQKILPYVKTIASCVTALQLRKSGDVVCFRKTATIKTRNFFDSTNLVYGNEFYIQISDFICSNLGYFDDNPWILNSNYVSNIIENDEYNDLKINTGTFTLVSSQDELLSKFKVLGNDLYDDLYIKVEEACENEIN